MLLEKLLAEDIFKQEEVPNSAASLVSTSEEPVVEPEDATA